MKVGIIIAVVIGTVVSYNLVSMLRDIVSQLQDLGL